MNLKDVNSKVIPTTSSYFKNSQLISNKHINYQKKKLAEIEFQHSLHKNKIDSSRNDNNHEHHDRNNINIASHRGYGGDARTTFNDTYPTFENQNLIKKKSNYNPNNPNSTTTNTTYQDHIDNNTNKTILYNQLLAPPRQPRSTLLLSGMGFNGHCTEHAMEVIRILQEKHL